MSAIDQLIGLDEESNRRRQKELYRHDLSFDEGRPIYQQPINLAHFVDDSNEEVFEEMVANIEGLHPDPEVKQLAGEFRLLQNSIDRCSDGYLEELEKEEVAKTIDDLRKEIEQLNAAIEQKEESVNRGKVELQSLLDEVHQYEVYLKDNE